MAYPGNKRNEIETLYKLLDFSDITQVIEPYCGSCVISLYIYTQKPNLKFILNDNNHFLKEMYEIIKDDEKIKEFENKINEILPTIQKKEDYDYYIKENYRNSNLNLYGWFIANKHSSIRPGMYQINSKMKPLNLKSHPICDFFKNANIEFFNYDGITVYDSYKNNKENMIILDPPYLNSYNDFYQDSNANIYEHLYKNKISNEEAKIYLILEYNWIIKLLFNDLILIQHKYDKIYQVTKKKTTHILVYNKN